MNVEMSQDKPNNPSDVTKDITIIETVIGRFSVQYKRLRPGEQRHSDYLDRNAEKFLFT